MTWNFLEGGHAPGVTPPRVQGARIEAAQALIARVRPDVLILNEALWSQPHGGHYMDYAVLFGFEHSCARLYDGHWGNAILSRLPVQSCQDFRIYNRGGLLSTIQAKTQCVQVATYHPHPSRWPHNKASDYLALLEHSDPILPLLVGGDFNAISPADEPNHASLTKAFSRFSKTPGPDSARFIEGGRAVFEALSSAGMRDAIDLGQRHPTIPTRLISESDESGMRIDHLWANQATPILRGWVEKGPEADVASDHYPVVVELAVAT